MSKEMMLMFLIAFALFAMQAVGGVFQIKNYKTAIKRLHGKGNVGVGQKKGRFFNGHIVIIACDSDKVITGCEVLDGRTFISKFHPVDKLLDKELIGTTIDEFLSIFQSMEKKQKYYRGYINALEALQMRFENAA